MMERMLREIARSPENRCFGCGPDNPVGLRLQVEREGDRVRAEFTPLSWHEGWAGVVHGGVLAALLDEVMAYAIFYRGLKAVTARMEIRYRAPARKGDTLLAEARITRDSRKLVDIAGQIYGGDRLLIEATGRFMKMGPLEPRDLAEQA